MDTFFEGALWFLIISGGFALLGLAAEGVERFCDCMDDWWDAIAQENYVDD